MKTCIFLALSLFCCTLTQAQTVRSLDKVPETIRSSEVATEYAYQMGGIPKPDGFGSLSKQDEKTVQALLTAISPDTTDWHWALIGLKPWQNGQSIAVACAYKTPVDPTYAEQPDRYAECGQDLPHEGKRITVALVESLPSGGFALAAEPYTEILDGSGQLQTGKDSVFSLTNHMEETAVGGLDRLDLAAYQLNETTHAFGIRYSYVIGYSGGGAFNQAVTLFAVIQGRLKPVLSVPTYAFEDLAGKWNHDGTRQHHVEETEYLLSVLPKQTNGFHDIVWGSRNTRFSRRKVFKWQPSEQHYE